MASERKCACASGSPVIGKCPKCGVGICERCLVFVEGRPTCIHCAKNRYARTQDETGLGEATMLMDVDDAPVAASAASQRRRRMWQTLRKRARKALYICAVAGAVLLLVYLPMVMLYCSSLALEAHNPKNPLSRITLSAAGRVCMLYRRYDLAAGLYGIYTDRYPDAGNVSYCKFRIGLCYLNAKEFRAAKWQLTRFIERWPDHELKDEASRQIEIVNRLLR